MSESARFTTLSTVSSPVAKVAPMEMVTFTAPATPGDYFFWCDVHQNAMTGILHVQ